MRYVVFVSGMLACTMGCGEPRRELREWQPSDHQPPPAVAPEGQGEAQEGGDPAVLAAQAIWGKRCASCHGVRGRGDGEQRPPGADMPDLTAPGFHDARSDAQLAEVIRKGRGLMPAFEAELTQTGVDALVAHVRSLRR